MHRSDPDSRLTREHKGDVMDGAVRRQKGWIVRLTTVATARFIVAAMPIGHKSGVSCPAA
jgi:hypothetical protein